LDYRLTKIEPRPLDTCLATQPCNGAVAIFPLDQVQDQINIFANLLHGKPFIGGLFNANQPPQYTNIKPILDQFPTVEAMYLLREPGITFIVVDKASYPDLTALDTQLEAEDLVQLTDLDQHRVYGFEK
jgi:hypothetical protein